MNFQEALDEVMDCFDFNLAYECLTKVENCWLNKEDYPSTQSLRRFVRENFKVIYNKAIMDGHSTYYSGCFELDCWVEDVDDVFLSCKVVPEEWNTGG